jgi:gentisate 1,2-dioxygenase
VIVIGNKMTEDNTKTLTHTLWSLLNVLPAKDKQRPHRHNSVALDLCVSAENDGVYTLMGPELDEEGLVMFFIGDSA